MNPRRSDHPATDGPVATALAEPEAVVSARPVADAVSGGVPAEGVAPNGVGATDIASDADALLSVRVSDLLARHPAMLAVLIDHGFAPLAQPALRVVLAPTVTLAQALRIRGLAEERERDLLRSLVEVADAAREDGRAWR